MKVSKYLVMIFCVVVGVSFLSSEAFGISAWARRYGVSCGACHWAGYRLNRDGIDFLRRGHSYAGDKASEQLKDYLSFNTKIRFNDGNDSNTLDNKIGETTFEHHAFALYSGGSFGKGFSYFTEIYLHEREGTPTKLDSFDNGGRSKLAEAFLQYTAGKKNYFTVRVGQIANQFFSLQGAGARLSETRNYLVNNTTIKTNAGASNNWLPRQRDVGLELGGYYSGLQMAFAVTNGNGNKPTNVVENKGQSAKDYYFSLDYTAMQTVQAGLVYHKGKLEDPTLKTKNADDFYRLGVGFNINPTDRLWILNTFLVGKDTDAIPLAGKNRSVLSNGYAFEVDFLALPKYGFAPFVKYDYFTHNGTSGPGFAADTLTKVYTIGFTVNLFDEQRGRIAVEWSYWNQKLNTNAAGISTFKDLMKDQNIRIELSFML